MQNISFEDRNKRSKKKLLPRAHAALPLGLLRGWEWHFHG